MSRGGITPKESPCLENKSIIIQKTLTAGVSSVASIVLAANISCGTPGLPAAVQVSLSSGYDLDELYPAPTEPGDTLTTAA